jgi:pimeloyl-ACP methyl ester carboxylesterase
MPLLRVPGPEGYLQVDDGGFEGLPIVFVHSIAGTVADWSAQLAHLRPQRRAIAMELRGHGESEPPSDDDYQVESLARDIAAVANGLGLNHFVLVGHGLGAAAAIAYAGGHQEQVAGLVLVNAPAPQAANLLTELTVNFDQVAQATWDRLLDGAGPKVRNVLKNALTRVPRTAALNMIRGVIEFNPLPALRAYGGPKLAIVTSHHDSPHDLHSLVPGLAFQAISDASHWPHLDQPAEFNRILDEFLVSLRSPNPLALGVG